MDEVNEPPSHILQSFGRSFDPGPVEEPVRNYPETEVSVGKTHGDPSALLKRGVGHMGLSRGHGPPPEDVHRHITHPFAY